MLGLQPRFTVFYFGGGGFLFFCCFVCGFCVTTLLAAAAFAETQILRKRRKGASVVWRLWFKFKQVAFGKFYTSALEFANFKAYLRCKFVADALYGVFDGVKFAMFGGLFLKANLSAPYFRKQTAAKLPDLRHFTKTVFLVKFTLQGLIGSQI